MKREEMWANRRTVPDIKRLTILKWLFGLFSALNFIVATAIRAAGTGDGGLLGAGILGGVICIFTAYLGAISPAKRDRDLASTIGDGFIFCSVAAISVFLSPTWIPIALLCIEAIVILVCIFTKRIR